MTQLDRIEARLDGIDSRTRNMETALAELRGEKRGEGKAAFWIRQSVTAVLGFVAGLGGGSVKLPGLH